MRIWFNHWFSTVYHLINLIKKTDVAEFTVIGSNENELSVYKCACDEWYREPCGGTDEEYVAFCLSFCREHKIDIFAPRKRLLAISRAHREFEALGVRLLVDSDYDTLALLEDKAATYELLRPIVPSCIPEYRTAHSYGEFLAMYEELKGIVPRVCYKLVEDEGARSFRVVDNRIESPSALLQKPGSKITEEAAKRVLSAYDFSIPVLLMPYLSEVEVSVDALATPHGNLIIPRFKTNKRYSEIIYHESLMQTCDKIMDSLGLRMPMNIQFKKEGGEFYLLEINPRMSGGLQLSCEASGVNLPELAIRQLLGESCAWEYPSLESRKVVHIETPICLE